MRSVLGDHEINFQVSSHAVLGDPMFNFGETQPTDQVALLLRRLTLLERQVDQLEARMPRARWHRFVVWVKRYVTEMLERMRYGRS